jgi:hypothetical protein
VELGDGELVKRNVLVVFVLALVLRLGWVVTLPETLMWPDEEEFAAIARHLAAGDGYVSGSYRANPILPFYLAAVFRVFGESHLAARIGQALMGAFTCVLVAATATRLLGAAVGTVSGLLLAVYLPHVYLSGVFYVECLFTMMIALTVHLAVRSLDDDGHPVRWGLATGASFAVTVLTRPIFLAYLPFLIAAIAWAARPRFGRVLAMAAALVVATVLVILPWTMRNRTVFGKSIVVSSGLGTKLWQGNNEGAVGDADDRDMSFRKEIWKARIRALAEPERSAIEARYREVERRIAALQAARGDAYDASDAVLGPLAVEYIRTHPLRTIELFVKKLGTLFLPFSKTLVTNPDTSLRNRVLAALAYLPVLALAPIGVWLSRGRARGLPIVYGLIVALASAYALLTTCTRFRLPLDPYLIVFAAVALVELWQRRIGGGTAASRS